MEICINAHNRIFRNNLYSTVHAFTESSNEESFNKNNLLYTSN